MCVSSSIVTVLCGRDSKQLRVMKQRLKQLEFQEKLKQKLDVAGHCDVDQNSPAVCSTTPTGRHAVMHLVTIVSN